MTQTPAGHICSMWTFSFFFYKLAFYRPRKWEKLRLCKRCITTMVVHCPLQLMTPTNVETATTVRSQHHDWKFTTGYHDIFIKNEDNALKHPVSRQLEGQIFHDELLLGLERSIWGWGVEMVKFLETGRRLSGFMIPQQFFGTVTYLNKRILHFMSK